MEEGVDAHRGAYEQVVAKELRDGDIRVTKRTYDQFNVSIP
ncbi:hypothetical protein C499_05975 [Halogeometricum borinquense DSM 11551]|uniref:Uncharacterized protein n=1 Tax=Halogeometricum borinquense (strain ATCC 700274 / DSM 11551 / JCM 10706 / KCTC 4070 / PR3) TaxID=469382 RepID=E4NVC6_HALBP|nr:hypothetical protein Hbor_35970 [Halogeometricum borinquense DSM 11551]ELY29382.1 hypothetical protein C499_05975 [Halogeometricum borinquense DSM 11551]